VYDIYKKNAILCHCVSFFQIVRPVQVILERGQGRFLGLKYRIENGKKRRKTGIIQKTLTQ
jgi:hypothetical protein